MRRASLVESHQLLEFGAVGCLLQGGESLADVTGAGERDPVAVDSGPRLAVTGGRLLNDAPDHRERQPGGRVVRQKLIDLLGSAHGMLSQIVQTIVLSLVLQAYILAAPFYMQLAIDEVVLKDDRSLLMVLVWAFGLAMLFNAGASLLRSRIFVS